MNSIEQMTEQARNHLDNHQVSEAQELYAKICEQDDSNAEAWLMLGAIHGEGGDIDEAVSCIRKAIEIDPAYASAYLTLAQILYSQGDREGAANAARAATSADPDYTEAWLYLSAIHGELGNLTETETACNRVVDLKPDRAEAHVNLGNAYRMQGKLTKAEDSYRKAINLNLALASAHSGLGSVLVALKKFDEASVLLEKAVELQPDMPETHNNLGVLYLSLRNLDNAMSSFNTVITLSPGYAPGHANIGNIHMMRNEYNQAIDCYKKALGLMPELIEAHLALGNAYKITADRDAARSCYEQAVQLKPDYLEAHYNLGVLEEGIGNLDKALQHFDEAIRLNPNHVGSQAARASVFEKMGDAETAYGIIKPHLDKGVQDAKLGVTYATLCKHSDSCDDATSYLRNLLLTPDLENTERADILFSLGKLLDQQEQYDDAFAQFSQANAALAGSYDPQEYVQYTDNMIAASSADTIAAIPAPTTSSDRPVFIVGMPRSGTTLVEQILSAHPQVFGGGELGYIFKITDNLQYITGSDKTYPDCMADIDQDTTDAMANEYMESLGRLDADATRVTDKMPHNYQHLGLIHALFPDATLINVTRNPIDTCLSGYFHRFGGHHPYSFNLEYLASHYQQYERLMKHWKDDLKLPILDVCYEDLVADMETISKQIINHCGLDWDDSCLDFHKSGRIAGTASYDQVRQPIYTSAINRWKHYEQHIGPLLDQFRDVVDI